MKKYFTSLIDSKDKNTVEILGDSKALFNGKEYNFEYKFINNNVLVLRVNDKNYFLTITENVDNNFFEINLDSKTYKVVCKSELDLMIDKMSNNKSDDKHKKEIYSPMPGIITRLDVVEHQKVSKGDVMLVLEAMKMENEIKATKECVIKKVNVEALKSVEKGELLIVLE